MAMKDLLISFAEVFAATTTSAGGSKGNEKKQADARLIA